jgi:hypothetical protein
MRGPSIAAVAALLTLLLAGCSSSNALSRSPTPARTPSPAAPATRPSVTPAPPVAFTPAGPNDIATTLLALIDLGEGWKEVSRDRPAAGADTSTGCDGALSYTTRARVTIEFSRTDRPATLSQRVTAFAPGDAARAINDSRDVAMRCPEQHGTDASGHPTTFTFKLLPFPDLGDQTLALRVETSQEAGGLDLTIVQVRRGDAITALLYTSPKGGTGSDEMALLERMARLADTKLAAWPGMP